MASIDEAFRKKLLDTFKFVINFLDANNIRWFAGAGTAIGAVRHKGLIPWDDDIDILVPREDYDRLIAIRNNLNGTGYEFVSIETNQGYYLPFAKIIDGNTTLVETDDVPFVIGVYVDIFPMDETNLVQSNFMPVYRNFMKSLSLYLHGIWHKSLKDNLNYIKAGHYKVFLRNCFGWYYRRRNNYYYKKFIEAQRLFYNADGCNCVSTGSMNGLKELYEKSWFDTYINMPFEDFTVRMPIGYDKYLTLVYGDYMTPPPPEKRVNTHDWARYYINLKERLSIDEVKNRLKKGENCVF